MNYLLPHKNLHATITVVVLLLLSLTPVRANESDSRYISVGNAYSSGDVVGAIDILNAKIALHDVKTAIRTKWLDLTTLIGICISIDYSECFEDNIASLSKILKDAKGTDDYRYLGQDYNYYIHSYLSYLDRESIQSAVQGIDTFRHNLFVLSAQGSARGNLLAAKLYLMENQPYKAREHLDSAIAALASGLNIDRFNFAIGLRDVLELLMATGDSLLASRIYYSTGNFIPQTFSNNIPHQFMFRLMEANLLTINGELIGANKSYKDAEELLGKLNLPFLVDQGVKNTIYEGLSLNCVLRGDLKCAVDNINKHPYRGYVESGNLQEIDNQIYYLSYLILHVITHSLSDLQIDPKILNLLDEGILQTGVTKLDERFRAYKLFAQGMSIRKTDQMLGNQKIIKGASILLTSLVSEINESPSGFVQIGSIEQFIIKMSINALYQSQDEGLVKNIALQAFELSNRTVRDEESQFIVDLANAGSIDRRRKYHAYNRLDSNHSKMKLNALKNQIERLSQEINTTDNSQSLDTKTLSLGLDFTTVKGRILKILDSDQDEDTNTIKYIPNIRELRSWLGEDEAYISITFFHGKVFSLCVTKEASSLLGKDFIKGDMDNFQKLFNDYRVIENSLRSDHPPSLSLDSQFPVSASINIYNTFLKDALSCGEKKSHIIWSPHDSLLSMPLSALLEEKPVKLETGWDLVNASWLGKKYSFTYASSSSSFMASRELRRIKKGYLPFIGFGDPVLSGKTINGDIREEVAIPDDYNNPNSGLYDFYELPETSSELKGVSNVLGNSSVLYLRRNASERNLRREILSRYNIVAFSTHGLIKDEIVGLEEAALALTPQETGYEAYDGLLKSSEISNLNFSSDFAILSACNTDNFDLNDFSAEVQGISTAFSYAGSPTTVASLWNVDSKVSETLIIDLVDYYSKDSKRGISNALRKSINKHFNTLQDKSFAHPRFWAAYRVYGDGGLALRNSLSRNDSNKNISNYYIGDNNEGGEAIRVISSENNSFYVDGYEDLQENDRFKSFVAKIDKDLGLVWKHNHNKIANTGILYKVTDGLILSGYETQNNLSKTLLYKLDDKGNFLWQKWLGDKSPGTYPVSGFNSKNGQYIGMFTEADVVKHDYKEKFIHFYQIDENGDVTPLAKESMVGVSNLKLGDIPKQFVTSDNVYYSFKSRNDFNTPELDDVYGYGRSCVPANGSLLYEFDLESLKLIQRSLYSDLFISSIIELDDGKIIGAGVEGRYCEEKHSIIIFELNSDLTYKVIYREKTPFSTSITKLMSDGKKLYLVGTSERVYDIKKFEGLDPEKYSILSFEAMLDESVPFGLRDLFALEFRMDGSVISKDWLQGGSNIYVSDAALIDGKVSIFGAMDGEVSWYQLQ